MGIGNGYGFGYWALVFGVVMQVYNANRHEFVNHSWLSANHFYRTICDSKNCSRMICDANLNHLLAGLPASCFYSKNLFSLI